MGEVITQSFRRRAYSCRQAAERLGVSHQTLRRWIADGEGPRAFIKRGPTSTTIRIMSEDLESYIRTNTRGR